MENTMVKTNERLEKVTLEIKRVMHSKIVKIMCDSEGWKEYWTIMSEAEGKLHKVLPVAEKIKEFQEYKESIELLGQHEREYMFNSVFFEMLELVQTSVVTNTEFEGAEKGVIDLIHNGNLSSKQLDHVESFIKGMIRSNISTLK